MKTDGYIKLTSVCLSAVMVTAAMPFISSNAASGPALKINTISIESLDELTVIQETVDLLDEKGNPIKAEDGKTNLQVTNTYHLVKMEVSIANNPGFLTGAFGIEYDGSLIYDSYNDFNAGTKFQVVDNPDAHLLWFSAAGSSTSATANASVEERIFELTFKIPEDVTGGAFPFKFVWEGKDGSAVHWYTDKNRTDVASDVQANAVDGMFSLHGGGALNYTSLTMNQGSQEQLVVMNAAASVFWFSTDESVATVSDNGLVTAVGPGECDINAFIDSELQLCHIKVTPEDYYTIVENGEITITNPYRDIYLRCPDASGGVTWTSSKPQMLTISADGKLTLLQPGVDCSVPIFAAINGGKTLMCTINVKYGDLPPESPSEQQPSTSQQVDFIRGDADGNGDLNILDVIAINRIVLGKSIPTEAERLAADYDGDGQITASDSLAILKYLVGIR